MPIPIEGYSVVAQKDRIKPFLDSGAIQIRNSTALADDDIWRCSFMQETDALKFLETLSELGLNASQGPDSDVVLVSEFDCSINPYCEWLLTGKWEKAVIAWKVGSLPRTVFAREGWDPKVGSGLLFYDSKSQDDLQFLRLQGNIEVYLNKKTGKEVYLGRTSVPVEALFTTASKVIIENLVTAGEKPVSGEKASQVADAVQSLEKVITECPSSWRPLWCHGKGQMALGNYDQAYKSLRRAYEIEKNEKAVLRELAGICLQIGEFTEAVEVAKQATAIDPSDDGLIANLALAYLLAGRIPEAQKAISAAVKLNNSDEINRRLFQIINEVADGKRPKPSSLAALTMPPTQPKRKFWEFWKS